MMSTENIRYRRVLLQMDTSTHCRETLDAAIEIAARLQTELHGIFIEDSDLISVGGLDFVREFSLSSATARTLDNRTLEAQLKALARAARRRLEDAGSDRKVAVGFATVRGDFQKAMANAAREADLIVIEGTGRLWARSYRARLPGRNMMRRIPQPILLLKGGKPLAKQFTVICDSAESARKCIAATASLPTDAGREITLLPSAAKASDAEKLATALASAIDGTDPHVRIGAPVSLQANAILQRLGAPDSLLIINSDGPLLSDQANARLLLESTHPILLVH